MDASQQPVGRPGGPVRSLEPVTEERPALPIAGTGMPPVHFAEGLRAAGAVHKRHPPPARWSCRGTSRSRRRSRGAGHLLKSRVTVVDAFMEALEWITHEYPVADCPGVVHRPAGLSVRASRV
jgi:serine/threonine-protein kinase PknK